VADNKRCENGAVFKLAEDTHVEDHFEGCLVVFPVDKICTNHFKGIDKEVTGREMVKEGMLVGKSKSKVHGAGENYILRLYVSTWATG
jgi:hypothetical protein